MRYRTVPFPSPRGQGWDVLYSHLWQYRYAWISGAVGVGKTSLAVAVALHYASLGYRIVANFPLAIASPADRVRLAPDGMAHLVVIYDEGGTWLPPGAASRRYRAYLAKLDVIALVPSVVAPPPDWRSLRVHGVTNYGKVGVPIVEYRLLHDIGLSRRDYYEHTIYWTNPHSVYGYYSRQYPAYDDGGIGDMLDRLTSDFLSRFSNAKAKDQKLYSPTPADATYALLSAADEMAAAANAISASAPATKRKRKLRILP